MDNIVQNINIEDIIPSKFQPSNEEMQKIEELAKLIKTFGLIDPIIVRSNNNKYEIILGNDKYQAAKLADLKSIPVLIKEVDDDVLSQYKNIDNQVKKNIASSNNNFTIPLEEKALNINQIQQEKHYENKNQDIVSLAKLSQEEYERNEFKMNNEQLNNNMMNNNFTTPTPVMNNDNNQPAFGGKFYPSLEDEPTNMNMGGISVNNFVPQEPVISNNLENNNLIDLTDISLDKQQTMDNMPQNIELNTQQVIPNNEFSNIQMASPDLSINQPPISDFNTSQIPQLDNINTTLPQNNFELPAQSVQPMNNLMANPINIDNLQNVNSQVQLPPIEQPQFDLPQNLNQISEFSQNINIPQNDFGINNQIMNTPELPNFNQQSNSGSTIMNQDFGMDSQPVVPEINNINQKDITPVVNTIKNLSSNLESFGYKINITEENSVNSTKIIIEIEK